MRIEVGARVQRGRVISVATDGVIVQSEETGVPTLPIKNLLPSDPAVESRVLFIEFDDGEGAVIALL
ncbi:MAG: hypothetical protein ACOX63_09755 [Christensenellales bacterium]|jgi:hypothetical protein